MVTDRGDQVEITRREVWDSGFMVTVYFYMRLFFVYLTARSIAEIIGLWLGIRE
jgi:hypothetical protein